ncbi:DUF3106 domain-containing protein [uncultured Oxalicibacterium sp.]|uniref:DUF3106 domain-containing protein n=1 Tax=uncultured Oxalicibacterium sp. TaxID=1168540 RepID=UPI0025FA321E|nr:DUF3106 domain-containing protein [uncultured Oxalicibacterium sp.]
MASFNHAMASTAPATPGKPAVQAPKTTTKNDWKNLSSTQRTALAPLEKDWSRLDDFRREKWIELANRFSTMTPSDQARMQERMRDWVELSPEQRRLARENYKRVQKLKVEKARQWEEYQQLSEEKKKELAATAVPKKPLVNPPRRATQKTPIPSNASTQSGLLNGAASATAHNGREEAPHSESLPVQSSPSTP